jgi:integrase
VQSERGAEAYERVLRRELLEADEYGRDPLAAPPPLFKDFATRWMRDYVEAHNRPSSRASKSAALRKHLVPFFALHRLDNITTAHIDAFIATKQREGLAPKTVLNLTSMLHCMLGVAEDWKLIRYVPKTRWVKVPLQRYRYLKTDETERLIAASPPGFIRTLLLFFVRTGARFGEAAALRWEDLTLDGSDPRVHFWQSVSDGNEGPTKTNRDRHVPLTPDLIAGLQAFKHNDKYVFWPGTGTFMRPDSMQRYLSRVVLSAGIPYVSWKDLRHTFATELTAKSVSLRVVQELLGHTTIKMTARYAHVAPSTMRDAVLKLVPSKPPESAYGCLIATRPLRGRIWSTSTTAVIVKNRSINAKTDHEVGFLPGSAKGSRTASNETTSRTD